MSEKCTLGMIYGGKSSEHEVSLLTAFSVMEAVDYNKYDVLPIYIQLDGTWVRGQRYTSKPSSLQEVRLKAGETVSLFDLKQDIDVAFPVIHGPYGEDGTLQGLLEMIDVPYVGSGVLGSSLGMDKVMMKHMFAHFDLPQCKYLSFTRHEIKTNEAQVTNEVEETLGFPCFVKPVNLGSSVGISKAKDKTALVKALQEAAKYDRKVIVEEMLVGREVEVGLLGNDEPLTSVVGEIRSVNEFYDYSAKYKNIGTELDIPADLPEDVVQRIQSVAKKAYQVLECSGLSRADFFYNEDQDQVWINEVNTMPGFTPYSMYPMLFKSTGISYPELIEKLISLGLERYEERKQNQVEAESLE
ncbi:D-alanine--D-alanine ligase [Caldalkalibacillus salinus]|uniref:D-alanine--D-alanine ligase n=1 Tax=Caldalkalibacillus salinus TaxID=2803787 RepID=UPI001922A637